MNFDKCHFNLKEDLLILNFIIKKLPVYIFSILILLSLTTSCAIKKRGVYHKIGRGETLWRIAYTYDVDIQDIAELNNIKNTTQIKAGQRIYIPGVAKVKKITPAAKQTKTTKYNKAKTKTKVKKKKYKSKNIKLYKGKFAWPVKGKVISKFGMGKNQMHKGIDIGVREGTDIKASHSGKVVYSDNKLPGYGNVVILQHSDDFYTVYANNSKNLVRNGDKIKKGGLIGKSGSSGHKNRAQVHFEIRDGKKVRNPLFFLP